MTDSDADTRSLTTADDDDNSGTTGDPVTPVDIDATITQLETEANQARATRETADRTLTDREKRLTALRAVKKDRAAIEKAYSTEHDRLEREQQSYRDFQSSEKARLAALLGPLADEVAAKDAAAKTEGDELAEDVREAGTALAGAETDRDAAKTRIKELGVRANEIRQLATTVGKRLNLLNQRRTEIEEAVLAGKGALAYWLLTERDFTGLLDQEPELIPPDDLAAALVAALAAQAAAEQTLPDLEKAVNDRKAELVAARKKLDDHTANGEKKLRADLAALTATTEGDRTDA